jgi:type I restriction enzyme S subunit
MKVYENYKDSRISFVGEIPNGWKPTKLKYYVNVITGNTPSTIVDDFFSDESGIPWVKPSDLNEFKEITTSKQYLTEKGLSQSRLVRKGSVLIGGIGDIGKLGVAGCDITTNQQIHSVEGNSDKVDDDYLKYLLYFSVEELQKNSFSVVLPILTKTKLLDLDIILPTLVEQTTIASFLDYKTRLIEDIIEKKKRLIDLLKEKRQAVINEAVTKGLNPNASLIDSGVEWLGKIPEHWEVKKLKHIADISFSSVDRHEYNEELKVSICHYPDAYRNDKINKETTLSSGTCTSLEYEKYQLKKGQVIITKDSESANDIGVPTYVEETLENAVCGYHLAILEPQSNKINGEFLFRFIQTSNVAIYFENNSNGVTRFGLGKPKIENLFVMLPSIEEQSTIIEYINYQSELIDKSVSTIKLVIEKLQTYRQSLISEAVTGKIDVRDWQPQKNN